MSGSSLAAVGLGLIASLSWGTSDFSGGLASKRASVFAVMIVSFIAGLALLIVLALLRAEPLPALHDLAWGAAAGILGSIGLTAQYRALAVGRMGLNAPVTAVVGAALPVVFTAFSEGLPPRLTLLGFGVALVSVWLIARPDGSAGRPDGLSLAFMAGLCFGLFFILMGQVREGAVFWPLAAARGASLPVLWMAAVAGRYAWRPRRQMLPLMLLAGALDVGGNTFFLLASQAGRLDVASITSSLYPAVTVVLARWLLDERISRWQTAGVVAALLAIPLIAL